MSLAAPVSAADNYRDESESRDTKQEQVRVEEREVNKVDLELDKEVNATDTERKDDAVTETNEIGLVSRREDGSRGDERRSEVANVVEELLGVADRDGGIGEKVREIAGSYEKDSKDVEDALKELKNRGQFRKFLFGPDYKRISDAEEMIKRHNERAAELEVLLSTIKTDADRAILGDRIAQMKMISAELQDEVVGSEEAGFSLFGWLNKIIYRK